MGTARRGAGVRETRRRTGEGRCRLERDLGALGTPWGTDRPGSGFAAAYGPARGGLVGGLRGLAGGVGKVGTGLHAMAERTTDTDTSAASGFGAEAGNGVTAVAAVHPTTGATPGAAPAVPKDMSV
ncbi:hypothetical protein ACFV0O_13985 [Kitasatospora sp. NPDC059577]|uniref:hypothetical protein n=1 Tax=Kitasatospora sp. NPDC059577 TaxID=3346873 RepID=UPI0036848B3B